MGRVRLYGRRARDAGRTSVRILLSCPYDWGAPGGVRSTSGSSPPIRARGTERRAPVRDHRGTPGSDRRAPVRVPYRGTVAPISFSPGSWRRIRSAMRSFDPDVIHAHEPLTPSTSMLAVLAASAPVVATFTRRSIAQVDGARRAGAASGERRIDAGVAVSGCGGFLRASRDTRPLEVVPNGVDVGAFAHPRPLEGLPGGGSSG